MELLFTFSEKFQSMNLGMIGKGPGMEYCLMPFWGALWAFSIIEIIILSATSAIIPLIPLSRVSLVLSRDFLFSIWRIFRKINVLLRSLFLISSILGLHLFRLVVRLVIWLLISSIWKSWFDIFSELSVIHSVLEWASSNAALADLSISLTKFKSSWCRSFKLFSTEVTLFSIVPNFSSISCFNSSKMTGVTLVDAADTFRDGDEVLFVSSRRHYKFASSRRHYKFVSSRRHYKFASSRRHYKFTEKIQDSYKIHGNTRFCVWWCGSSWRYWMVVPVVMLILLIVFWLI